MTAPPAYSLEQAFSEAFGSAPSGVWSAPGRVNLMGEHTDYNEGLCLPLALPQRTYAAARPLRDRRLRLRSLQSSQRYDLDLDEIRPGFPGGWGSYVAGVLWAMQDAGHRVQGMDIMVDGRVPEGAGLSSSAALECAVAAAVSDLFDLGLLADDQARASLARICVKAENTIALAPTGGMDQSAALRCQAGHVMLLDCRDGSIVQVPLNLAAHGLSLLVMDTRTRHSLVDGQYDQRRRDCQEAAIQLGVHSLREVPFDNLGDLNDLNDLNDLADLADLDPALARLTDPAIRARARHVITEIERARQAAALLLRGRVKNLGADLGALMNASHSSMRDDFQISCAELDAAVDTAVAHGALGARMTGGGFGGSAVALVPTRHTAEVTAAVLDEFADNGFSVPSCFPVTAGGPARREP